MGFAMQRYSVKISDHKKEFQISVRNVLIINGGGKLFWNIGS